MRPEGRGSEGGAGGWRERPAHLARLCGLDAADFLARATEALPDPKSWAAEEAAEEAAEQRAGGADSSSAGLEEDPDTISPDEISGDEDESDAA